MSKYDYMTKEELVEQCVDKDAKLDILFKNQVLSKEDVMSMYKCESDKALRIMKMMFQMGYATKIGKMYYISLESQAEFLQKMKGKEVFI